MFVLFDETAPCCVSPPTKYSAFLRSEVLWQVPSQSVLRKPIGGHLNLGFENEF